MENCSPVGVLAGLERAATRDGAKTWLPRPFAVAVLAWALLVAFVAHSLWQGRAAALGEAAADVQEQLAGVERVAYATIHEADVALQVAAQEYRRSAKSDRWFDDNYSVYLEALRERVPQLISLQASDAGGLLKYGHGIERTSPARVDGDALFTRLLAGPSLVFAAPRGGRNGERQGLPLARRHETGDGRFGGIVIGRLDIDELKRQFAVLAGRNHSSAVLFDAAADVFVGHPSGLADSGPVAGGKMAAPEFVALWEKGQPSASFRTRGSDGVWRTYAYRQVGTYPLYAAVGVAETDYLAAWRSQAAATVALLALCGLLMVLLAHAWRRPRKEGAAADPAVSAASAHVAEDDRRSSANDVAGRKPAAAEARRCRRPDERASKRAAGSPAADAQAGHILWSAADGLISVDAGGRIDFINPAGCAMLGYSADEAVGRVADVFLQQARADGASPSAVAPSAAPIAAVLGGGKAVRIADGVFRHADGHAVPVMYAVQPIVGDGRIVGAVTSFVDMSATRAADAAREQALAAAENLARNRQLFLASMSHEIRTSLSGVLGFADIGARNYLHSGKARNAFAKIQTAGRRLLEVANDILDFVKIDEGRMQVECIEVSPSEEIAHAIELVSDRAGTKGIDLAVEVAPDVPRLCLGDPLRIGQILLNLLTNAVKFTETGGVTLSASRDGDELVFRVADTGIGMDAEQQDRLFAPFQQGDVSAARRFGGSGLGLAISRRLAELMDGSLDIEFSQPGVGSTFVFRLPCRPVSSSASSPASRPDAAGKGGRAGKPLAGISILAADDDALNRAILEEMLTGDGANLTVVANGVEAVDHVRRGGSAAYDLVLMDIQMPEMDGYDATRRILKLAPGLPVIGQSAQGLTDERFNCYAAGMVAHIAKPIDPEALVKLVCQHVPARHCRQASA